MQFERPYYVLDAQANNDYWGYVLGGGMHERGAEVTVTAYPAYRCTFEEWADGDIANPRTITLVSDTTLVAVFLYHPDTSSGGGDTLGIATASAGTVVLVPNPSDGLVRVEAEGRIESVDVYDVRGRLVARSGNATFSVAALSMLRA